MTNMRPIEKGQGTGAPTAAQDADVIDLGALFDTLWRGRLFISFVFLVAVLIGGCYAYLFATPMYRSTAVVMLNNREEQVVDLGSVMSGLGSDSAVINTEVEILKSRVLLGKVVDKLELTSDPEFNGALRTPSTFDKLKAFVKGTLAPSAPREPNQTWRREATINALLSSLMIRNIPQSLVFQVTVESTDQEKSARISDALVNLYILNQLEVKFEATEQATAWLTERVTSLKDSLEAAEGKVKDFRASTSLVSTEALQGLEVQVKETRDRIKDMEASRAATLARLSALDKASTPQQQAAASNDPQLLRMLPRVSEPAVAQGFQTRFEDVYTRTQADLSRQEAQLAALRASVTELERQAERQSKDLISLQQLTRDADASRLLYEYFLSRLKETSAQQGVQQADSRIISPAVVPLGAFAPRKSLILAMSGFLGLMLGSALVLIRESRNRAFRNSAQLERATGYPTIGQIPLIKGKRRKDSISYLKGHPSSAGAEAVRNLRTSIMLSNVDTPPKVIMVCSAVPGEGKTTVAMSMALNFSSMGKKVLLIEGDIRRRVFRQYLNSSETAEGIVSVLTGDKTFDEVVTHSDLIGCDVLLGDQGQANAADIFSSVRFSELIQNLRSSYDIIVVDSPPVLVVPDARVIAQQVDTTILVVKWDHTPREQVLGALREFDSVGKPVSGLVLNQISPRGMKRYGYGNNYGPYAGYGAKYYVN